MVQEFPNQGVCRQMGAAGAGGSATRGAAAAVLPHPWGCSRRAPCRRSSLRFLYEMCFNFEKTW